MTARQLTAERMELLMRKYYDGCNVREIRAYYATSQAKDVERLELGGFDYAGRGYRLVSPRQIS
jgi:hypothetical protein